MVEAARQEASRSRNILLLMASHTLLVDGLRRQQQQTPEPYAEMFHQVLRSLASIDMHLAEAGVYTAQGQFLADSLYRRDDIQSGTGFKPQIDPQLWLSAVLFVEVLKRPVGRVMIRLGMPVRDPEGELLGFLAINAIGGRLERILQGRDSALTRVFISDDAGVIATRLEGLKFSRLPQAVLQSLDAESTAPKFFEIEIEGQPFELSMARIGAGSWVGTLLDLNALYANYRWLIVTVLVSALVLAALAALLFYFRIAKLIIRPIDKLIDATRTISAGNYLPVIDIDSNDEIGELANSFRIMGMRLKESNDRVAQLAFFDPLTKLPNRETLRRSLDTMINVAERNHSLLGVLFIDLDDFKKVNDRLGHAAGDELLVVVGERLSMVLRSSDLVVGGIDNETDVSGSLISRRGGDEFNAILANVQSAHDIAHVAERLIESINEPVMLAGNPVCVSASIGVSIYPFDGEDADTLLRNADLAMYEAKSLGKNKYYIFTQAINNQVHARLEQEQQLVEGLRRSEFELVFQPRIRLADATVTAFEAFMRWNNPVEGVLRPQDFIALAEESHLIHDLGRWAMCEACDHIRGWDPIFPQNVRIALNISPRQLLQENFADSFLSLAEQFAVPCSRLEIELTETGAISDEALVTSHLQQLHAAGVKITLDDFGIGFSSVNFLQRLPIDSVKIDRSIVHAIDSGAESNELLSALLHLCARLQLETVAEGVETEAQLTFLQQSGCRQYQGNLLSEPVSAAEVAGFAGVDWKPNTG